MRSLGIDRIESRTNLLHVFTVLSLWSYFFLTSSVVCANISSTNLCQKWIAHTEGSENLPPHLLGAIARVESGRLNKTRNKIEPWPWTINVNGQGYFFATKEAALKAIRQYQKRGIKNIDVGCMQVSLAHHGHAFSSVAHALEPSHNVAYAARFLKQLRQAHASWDKAVAHYHSATPFYHIPYHQKVYRTWLREQRYTHLGAHRFPALTGVLPHSYAPYLSPTHTRMSRKGAGRRLLITTASLQDSGRLRHIRSLRATKGTYQHGIRVLRGRGSKLH